MLDLSGQLEAEPGDELSRWVASWSRILTQASREVAESTANIPETHQASSRDLGDAQSTLGQQPAQEKTEKVISGTGPPRHD